MLRLSALRLKVLRLTSTSTREASKHCEISPILRDLDQEVVLPLNDASAYKDLAWLFDRSAG
jgi:hypothetical protein